MGYDYFKGTTPYRDDYLGKPHYIKIYIKCDPDTHHYFRYLCDDDAIKMQVLINEVLRNYVTKTKLNRGDS